MDIVWRKPITILWNTETLKYSNNGNISTDDNKIRKRRRKYFKRIDIFQIENQGFLFLKNIPQK